VEVDVARGVNEVEQEVLAFVLVVNADGGGLDGDAAFALEVHVVEDLVAHLAVGDGAGALEHAVSEGALAVVDVGDDAEVADVHGGAGRGGGARAGRPAF